MRRKYDKDLFKDTTMTFGEHLEELRTCLFKAIWGLAIGFAVGLYFGGQVVEYIQSPLEKALAAYYQNQSITWVKQELEKANVSGEELPWTAEQIVELVETEKLLPEGAYVDPAEVLRQLKTIYPEQLQNVSVPSRDPSETLQKRHLKRIFFWRPIEDDARIRAKSLNPHEAFIIYIKASLLVGVILASWWIFYQIWTFVAAGLYPHEKKYIHVFLPISVGLFLAGAAVAFFFVTGYVLDFLFRFNSALGIDPDPRISEWLSFVLVLPFGFGISFQLPLVMLFLERIGIFDVQAYLSKWRVAVLVIAVAAMMLTPADPYSMILMAAPLIVLYFGGILFCKYMPRNRSPFDSDLDEEDETIAPEEGASEKSTPEKPKRRRFPVSPRAIIAILLALFLVFGWLPWKSAQRQKAAVEAVQKLGGTVYYDFQLDKSGNPIDGAKLPGPSMLRNLLGKNFFAEVVAVDLSKSRATDAAVETLTQFSGLQKLDLTDSKITDEAVKELRDALPDCKIVRDSK